MAVAWLREGDVMTGQETRSRARRRACKVVGSEYGSKLTMTEANEEQAAGVSGSVQRASRGEADQERRTIRPEKANRARNEKKWRLEWNRGQLLDRGSLNMSRLLLSHRPIHERV
jgi:hypothetical protein